MHSKYLELINKFEKIMSIHPKNDPEVSRVMMSLTSFPVVEKEKYQRNTKNVFLKIGITCVVDNKKNF